MLLAVQVVAIVSMLIQTALHVLVQISYMAIYASEVVPSNSTTVMGILQTKNVIPVELIANNVLITLIVQLVSTMPQLQHITIMESV